MSDEAIWQAIYRAAATPGLQPHEVANQALSALSEAGLTEAGIAASALRSAALAAGARHEYDDEITRRDVKAWLYVRADELGRHEALTEYYDHEVSP